MPIGARFRDANGMIQMIPSKLHTDYTRVRDIHQTHGSSSIHCRVNGEDATATNNMIQHQVFGHERDIGESESQMTGIQSYHPTSPLNPAPNL
jgi:hypothetical protein